MFSQAQTLKRACSHFELESPFPETIKKKRFSPGDNNNDTMGFNTQQRPLSPTTSVDEENRIYQLKQQLMEQQWRYNINNNNINNNNINNTFMTPISTPPNQMDYSNNNNSTTTLNNNIEPYCEIEDYMARGYEDIEYDSSNQNNTTNNNSNNTIQYGLYDLTQEELDMMMLDDTTLTNINTTY